MERAHAIAPATLSNLGPGFDVLGLALDAPLERIEAVPDPQPGIRITPRGRYGSRLPLDPEKNVAAYAARRVLELLGAPKDTGLELVIDKTIPPGSGLGSSAASSVAGAVATARAVLGQHASLLEHALPILAIARDAEGLAAGSAHLDNVAPALFGGFVAVVATDPPEVRNLAYLGDWHLAVILPAVEVRTADARAVLPEKVTRADAVENLRHLAALLDSVSRGDLLGFAEHLVDRLAVPYRLPLWPWRDACRRAALDAGALALEISGSGPAMFAPCDSADQARRVSSAVLSTLADGGLEGVSYVARGGAAGALGRAG